MVFKRLARLRSAPPPVPGQPSATRAGIGRAVAAALRGDPRVQAAAAGGAEIFRVPDFLDARTCAALIAVIDANRRPSTLLTDRGNAAFRTSESCDMDRWSDTVKPVDEAIAALLGIRVEQGETMQGQRYAPGQHFRAHHDYFDERESYWSTVTAHGGQRTWTAMVYLNDVADGGATWFPHAGIRVAPKRGLLLAWNNMGADGAPATGTLHEGTPVTDGAKYIVTKWFRERDWLR